MRDDEHRWRCLARYIVNMETKDERRAFLGRWEKRHGFKSVMKLRGLVQEEWNKR